jgi:hypothetical protein
MVTRILIFFPLVLFVLIRQLYANLLGVSRDALTAALVSALAGFALWSFHRRLDEVRRDFLWLDFINLVQFNLAAAVILAYLVAGRIAVNEAVFSVYYYCFAPFLIYAGFLLHRWKSVSRNAALVALACAYLVTVWVAVYEVLGIDFWLFQYDRWVLQKNFSGIVRASGLYGTQIDYGLLSFLIFIVAFYWNARHKHWFASLMTAVAAVGVLLSMSRAWVGAMMVVVLLHLLRAQSLRRKLKIALVVVLMGVALYGIADKLGFVDILGAVDPYTQDSNQARVEFFQNAPQWLAHYWLLGTGPGTQNGPDARDQKFIGDFLWLSTLVEWGTLLGTVLLFFRVSVIVYALRRTLQSESGGVLRSVTIAVCISFLLASFVDSAYAHFVSVSAFYVIVGLFLYAAPQSPGREAAAAVI